MIIIHGLYHFRQKRVAFRNDYCLSCKQPRRSVQIRSFDAVHIFWIPLIPLGFQKKWSCTVCGKQPELQPGTRRSFKWLGLFILLFLGVAFWLVPVEPDSAQITWVIRILSPLGAVFTLVHLLRTPKDASHKAQIQNIPPATDTACPFCGTQMLMLSSSCACPLCGVVRL
jgi:hypothetical protein